MVIKTERDRVIRGFNELLAYLHKPNATKELTVEEVKAKYGLDDQAWGLLTPAPRRPTLVSKPGCRRVTWADVVPKDGLVGLMTDRLKERGSANNGVS